MSRSNAAAALLFRRKGDGSTLNLDFTKMSELDSRFTFSRTTNATYINSSGYVANNISNLFFNTAWTSITLPTGWEEGINTAGTFTYNGNGTITLSAVSGRAVLIPASPRVVTLIGVPFTISFTVTAVSGSPTLSEVITTNAGTDTFTVNGIARTSGQVLVADDLITCTSTATSTAHAIRIGLGVLGSITGTKSVTIKNPQANIGLTAQTYIANASTSTAYYAPRFDYNPTTLAPNGLLIESAATNLTKRSDNAFSNAYWNTTANNVTAVDSAVTSPTGVALTASTLTEIAGASVTRHIHQTTGEFTPTVSTSYTMSAWVKQPPSAAVRYVQFAFFTAGFGATAYMNYDIQAGTVGTGGAAITASTITAYPSGWYRITATAPATATGSSGFQLGFSTTSSAVRTESYTVTGGSEKAIYLWGAQVQTGFGASSYIPTTTAQVTRATDSCIMSGTNLTSWFNNTEGTVLFIGNNSFIPPPSSFSANWALISAANSSRITQYTRHTTARIGASCRDSGNNALTFDSPAATTSITNTAEYKTAFALKSSDFAYSVNGAAVGLGDGVGVFDSVTSLDFTRENRNGHIKVFKFWPTRLTNAQLIAIST